MKDWEQQRRMLYFEYFGVLVSTLTYETGASAQNVI